MKALIVMASILFSMFSFAEPAKITIYDACKDPSSNEKTNPCNRLGYDNQTKKIIDPDKETVDILMANSKTVMENAKKFGVDPVVLAGVVAAENTMNVGIKDGVINSLIKLGISSDGYVPGYGNTTVGFGQINPNIAAEAESEAIKIDNRPKRTSAQIAKLVQTPEGSIYYAALLLKIAQDKYKEAGVDISERPEILSTLYNIGKVDDRVKRMKETGSQPKSNYFGYFVNYHYDALKKRLLESASAPQTVLETKEEVTLDSIPNKACKSEDVKNQISSVKSSGEYKSIYFTVGCDGVPMTLVMFSNGATGWTKSDVLKSVSKQTILLGNNKCRNSKIDDKCIQKIKSVIDDDEILSDLKTTKDEVITLKLYGNGSISKKIDDVTYKNNKVTDDQYKTKITALISTLEKSMQLMPAQVGNDLVKNFQLICEAYNKSTSKNQNYELIFNRLYDLQRAMEVIRVCNYPNIPSNCCPNCCKELIDTKEINKFCPFLTKNSIDVTTNFNNEFLCRYGLGTCKYNFEFVQNKIRQLADISCVEKIYSPDVMIVNSFQKNTGIANKIINADIDNKGYFKFKIKRSCEN